MTLAEFLAGAPVTYWSGGRLRKRVTATWLRAGKPVPYLQIAKAGSIRGKRLQILSRPIMGELEAESFFINLEKAGCII